MTAHRPRQVTFVLTQESGGPVDLTVGLAIELAGRAGGPRVTVIGPEPVTSAGDLGELLQPFVVSSKGDLGAGRALRARVMATRPDVVHAQDRRAMLMTAGLRRSVAHVGTYHGVPEDVPAAWAAGAGGPGPSVRSRGVLGADAVLARWYDRVLAPSTPIARMLTRQLRVPGRRVEVVANGVRLPDPRSALDEVRTVVTVGALLPRKATSVAVQGLALARRTHPHLRLRVIGDGPEREELDAGIRAWGQQDAVEMLGYRRDVPDLLRAADVLVLPSLNENQPLALMEAMGMGLACIATDVGGVAEMMPPGHGVLVPPGDATAIAEALCRYAASPREAAATAERAREHARLTYSVQACADRHLNVYGRVLAARGS